MYASTQWYTRTDREKWEREYTINGEGCYVLEVLLSTGKWLCLDATRNFKSYGRLINHSRQALANLRSHTPLLVRGKWRVGLYASRDIEKGEELSYDYGDQPNKPKFMKVYKVHLQLMPLLYREIGTQRLLFSL